MGRLKNTGAIASVSCYLQTCILYTVISGILAAGIQKPHPDYTQCNIGVESLAVEFLAMTKLQCDCGS